MTRPVRDKFWIAAFVILAVFFATIINWVIEARILLESNING